MLMISAQKPAISTHDLGVEAVDSLEKGRDLRKQVLGHQAVGLDDGGV